MVCLAVLWLSLVAYSLLMLDHNVTAVMNWAINHDGNPARTGVHPNNTHRLPVCISWSPSQLGSLYHFFLYCQWRKWNFLPFKKEFVAFQSPAFLSTLTPSPIYKTAKLVLWRITQMPLQTMLIDYHASHMQDFVTWLSHDIHVTFTWLLWVVRWLVTGSSHDVLYVYPLQDELKVWSTNCPSSTLPPALYPGEVVQLKEHRILCLDAAPKPLIGAMFITNYRVIFSGNSVEVRLCNRRQ